MAKTRYKYVEFAMRPRSVNVVTLAGNWATSTKLSLPILRRRLNPTSVAELSFQLSRTEVLNSGQWQSDQLARSTLSSRSAPAGLPNHLRCRKLLPGRSTEFPPSIPESVMW
jgi:hypothetical protein